MRRTNSFWTWLGWGLLVSALGGCNGESAGAAPQAQAAGAGARAGAGAILPGTGGSTGWVNTTGGRGVAGNCGGASTTGCEMKAPEGCGDGINNQEGIEACDDGNTVPGDGCNGACKVEPNWICPAQGKCTPKVICGDGQIGPGEVCDDGGKPPLDGDGCNATCTLQDPAYLCTPGQPCVRTSVCGNSRIETGEQCDDGNQKALDGCAANCSLETGWMCPQPGKACKPAARCGDGVVNTSVGEACDDGNNADGDGCSGDCKTKAVGCLCTPGQLCKCPEVRCGNGAVEGTDECDDGNQANGDGCSKSCRIETGYECPFSGAPCIAQCGDGILMLSEQCDPGLAIPNMNQACSATCRWNPGFACTATECHRTTCGDGVKEGLESCDDHNLVPGDGCSPACKVEPSCSAATGTCTSQCGDGIVMPAQPDGPVLPGGGCDDGNTVSGDGCSSACLVEPGYQCQQPELSPSMTVPVLYRDFRFGGDFEPLGATGQNQAVTGMVQGTLDAEGKPVFAGPAGKGYVTSQTTFAQWYRDVPGTNSTYKTTLILYNNGDGGYVNHWGSAGEQWQMYTDPLWCSDGTCTNCNPPGYIPGPDTACLPLCTPWGPTNTSPCAVSITRYQGNPVFFPVDNLPGMITPASEYRTALVTPAFGGTWQNEPGNPQPLHNFSFTSEVRYWFGYVASKRYVLDFTGDDDVWVFINRRLAVDIGGIHTPVSGRIELNATGGGTATITPSEGITTPIVQTVSLGMDSGGVYEIVVFQAERRTSASTYKLTLSGFNDAASECKAICGDGVVSPGEQCDNGVDKNLGGYNQCTPDCRLGPFCGDGRVDAPDEQCDDGVNDDEYGSLTGCAPNCRLAARCGDGLVQIEYGETCDDGVNSGQYGGCSAKCQSAGYCGNGVLEGPELCDDGVNDGSYGTCGNPDDPARPLPNCQPAPKCLDGVVQEQYGEQCEPVGSDDPNCTQACRKPGGCGDGIIQPPEMCDDGADNNTGDYGGCAPSCIFAPHCGDGIKNGPEECDDGTNTGEYGGCTPQCKLAPHCGDGVLQSPQEACDRGSNNGTDGICTTACRLVIYVPA